MADMEYDLMSYCIRHWGKWWANHFIRNKEVDKVYGSLRKLDLGTIIAILGDGSIDYQRHIKIKNKLGL
jgi:hypothetical protein